MDSTAAHHPDWCERNDYLCGPSDSTIEGAQHESRAAVFIRPDGKFGELEDGEGFTVTATRVRLDKAPVDPPPNFSEGLEITLSNPSYQDCDAHAFMSAQRVRDLAAWLWEQADALDA